jgi:hypothetical protein
MVDLKRKIAASATCLALVATMSPMAAFATTSDTDAQSEAYLRSAKDFSDATEPDGKIIVSAPSQIMLTVALDDTFETKTIALTNDDASLNVHVSNVKATMVNPFKAIDDTANLVVDEADAVDGKTYKDTDNTYVELKMTPGSGSEVIALSDAAQTSGANVSTADWDIKKAENLSVNLKGAISRATNATYASYTQFANIDWTFEAGDLGGVSAGL